MATAAACLRALSLVFLITSTAAFVTPASSSRISATCETKTSTSLAGTIRFVGKASANVSGDAILFNDDDENDKSLSKFLSSDASNRILLGTDDTKLISSAGDAIYECYQGGVAWFGLTLIPIFVNRIERGTEGKVTTSIEEARTEIEGGGGLGGNALASAMKRSEFEGRTIVTWKEGESSYHIEGDLVLNLTIKLPRILPLPPGFNAIGSKIVERTCRERLKQNMIDTKNAYIEWAEAPTTK
mmetsp:Transcript_14655/g.24914  ORF Transcript_14655/g.24914 Transcript_14655/m.24914 type:complete len:243 (+) Transcript_14655:97-825(+)